MPRLRSVPHKRKLKHLKYPASTNGLLWVMLLDTSVAVESGLYILERRLH